MISVMEMFGEKFEIGEVFIPEVLLYARAMNEVLPFLEPYLSIGKKEATGMALMASVQENIHDFDKNIAIKMLRGVGFKIWDMGVNPPVEKFLEVILNTDQTLWDYPPHAENGFDLMKKLMENQHFQQK
jgi:5-methyltetrahydrofolate--homocysteine methyltransferase